MGRIKRNRVLVYNHRSWKERDIPISGKRDWEKATVENVRLNVVSPDGKRVDKILYDVKFDDGRLSTGIFPEEIKFLKRRS